MNVGAGPGTPTHSFHLLLTSIPGKVEVEDVGAVDTEVLQPPKVGLQLPTGQLCLQQQDQMAKNKGVQGGRAGEREGPDGSGQLHREVNIEQEEKVCFGGVGSRQQGVIREEQDT